MWNVPIAAIPGPWPALPAGAPWLAGAATAAVLAVVMGLAYVLLRAGGRSAARRHRGNARVRRLHGVRAA